MSGSSFFSVNIFLIHTRISFLYNFLFANYVRKYESRITNIFFTGSSREFKGFSREVDKSILKSIWDRAGEFFPAINNVHLDIDEDKEIRIGHRPYSKALWF